ncbi:hypothetical protein PV325_000260, partial [Microctonus aethiopoides]
AAVGAGVLMIIFAAVLAALFPNIMEVIINREVALRNGSRAYGWWKEPPVVPRMNIYIYNVTNADEFLNNGAKPILQELGPYIYIQKWDKTNVTFNGNGTVTYNVRKRFVFSEN